MTDKPWTDEEFLRYVSAHAETQRCLFSMEHIKKFHDLAGVRLEVPDYLANAFRSMDSEYVTPLLKTAYARLEGRDPSGKKPRDLIGDGNRAACLAE